jgi:hypothetical protein
MRYRERLDGPPTEEILRGLVARANEEGAAEVVVETSHEAGDAWMRAGFTEVARVLVGRVEGIE